MTNRGALAPRTHEDVGPRRPVRNVKEPLLQSSIGKPVSNPMETYCFKGAKGTEPRFDKTNYATSKDVGDVKVLTPADHTVALHCATPIRSFYAWGSLSGISLIASSHTVASPSEGAR